MMYPLYSLFYTIIFSFLLYLLPNTLTAQKADSIELLRRAEANHLESQVNLAIIRSINGRLKDAHYWYKRAAKQNHPLACRMVGLNHLHGKGASKNPNIGERWLQRSAKLGDKEAIQALSKHCKNQNRTLEAIAWQFFIKFEEFEYSLPSWIKQSSNDVIEDAKVLAQKWKTHGKPPPYPTKSYLNSTPKYLELYLPNGDKFEGMTTQGIPNGPGKRLVKDGSSYLGEFSEGKENGYGTWFNPKGLIMRQGLWKDGSPVFSNQSQ